ncbi:MAG: 3-isopropylmalate dehydratase small subunit [Flaviflexus sp.]|nr:3-isopropylmalate dehydratase small subunit [Flaviflexus sp.]
MEKITTFTGIAAPLRRSNVDTDQIIPARFLKRVTRTGFAEGLFSAWRQDPDFVLNQEAYQGCSILVAGPDFGTGSSREHAVWALAEYGFKAVLAPNFADIFRSNAGKQGLIAGAIDLPIIERLWNLLEEEPGHELTVDLEARQVRGAGEPIDFEIDDYTRWRLMEGLDDIGLTLRNAEAIDAYEAARPSYLPRTINL